MPNRILLLLGLTLAIACKLPGQTPKRNDVIIDELFPDPSPPVQLPANEFIELKNVSAVAYDLKNWKLSDGSGIATISVNFVLQPDSFVILCSPAAVNALQIYGATIGLSNFPSLNNEGDIIALYSPQDDVIHAVGYSDNWYQNGVKSDGGWSLEMIDIKNPCAGSANWIASNDNTGGTPGKQNSVNSSNSDDLPPALLRTYTINDTVIVAVFDESLDIETATIPGRYQIEPDIGTPITAIATPPLFTEVMLTLPKKLSAEMVYFLKVKDVADCTGNTVGMLNTAKAGLPLVADSFDIVINEILFNPKADGYDYVELYNRSKKIVDLKQLHIANRNGSALTNNIACDTGSRLFFPGEYAAFTVNRQWVSENYVSNEPGHLLELSDMPSLPDDKGNVVLANFQGSVVDDLKYDHTWHFALIANDEGVALERIDYNQATQSNQNWTSAASTAAFGTPGYQNSQLKADQQLQGEITIIPSVFSPDNDGFDDYGTINYQMAEPGFVANISIFDATGRTVRALARNVTLTQKGYFRWDGLDDNQRRLPVGIYVVYTEIFNLKGKTKKFKSAIGIAKKF